MEILICPLTAALMAFWNAFLIAMVIVIEIGIEEARHFSALLLDKRGDAPPRSVAASESGGARTARGLAVGELELSTRLGCDLSVGSADRRRDSLRSLRSNGTSGSAVASEMRGDLGRKTQMR
jgi:hypothetical protein